jgi:hypothetical protein
MAKSRVYKSPQAIKSAINKLRDSAMLGIYQDGYTKEKADALDANLERLERFLLAQLEQSPPEQGDSQEEPSLLEEEAPKKPVGGWSW